MQAAATVFLIPRDLKYSGNFPANLEKQDCCELFLYHQSTIARSDGDLPVFAFEWTRRKSQGGSPRSINSWINWSLASCRQEWATARQKEEIFRMLKRKRLSKETEDDWGWLTCIQILLFFTEMSRICHMQSVYCTGLMGLDAKEKSCSTQDRFESCPGSSPESTPICRWRFNVCSGQQPSESIPNAGWSNSIPECCPWQPVFSNRQAA